MPSKFAFRCDGVWRSYMDSCVALSGQPAFVSRRINLKIARRNRCVVVFKLCYCRRSVCLIDEPSGGKQKDKNKDSMRLR